MKNKSAFFFWLIISLVLIINMPLLAEEGKNKPGEANIHVDIPVVIKKAKVVFDVGRVSFAENMPVALRYINLLAKYFKEHRTEGQIIAVFYGDATYLILKDQPYNARHNVTSGNPYKNLINESMALEVQFEVCVVAMKEQKLSNEDLLKGVKVNGGGNLRLVQLMEAGFVRLQP